MDSKVKNREKWNRILTITYRNQLFNFELSLINIKIGTTMVKEINKNRKIYLILTTLTSSLPNRLHDSFKKLKKAVEVAFFVNLKILHHQHF